jgi:hypothetical protein
MLTNLSWGSCIRNKQQGMALEFFVASFEYMVPNSQKIPMNFVVTPTTKVRTWQRNNESPCVFNEIAAEPRKVSGFEGARISPFVAFSSLFHVCLILQP